MILFGIQPPSLVWDQQNDKVQRVEFLDNSQLLQRQ